LEYFAAMDRFESVDSETVANPTYAIKTRFFDDFLLREAAKLPTRQVVLFGAGMDMRAYRLAWPAHVHIFELDLPEVLEYKRTILRRIGAKPVAQVRSVAVDLEAQWTDALLKAGFRRNRPTAWLAEGLTYYLDKQGVRRLLAGIASLGTQVDRVGVDLLSERPSPELIFATAKPVTLLRSWGWKAKTYNYVDEGARLGRPWPYPEPPLGYMLIAKPTHPRSKGVR
jgi:methyltransferase (TIGR00027 family)